MGWSAVWWSGRRSQVVGRVELGIEVERRGYARRGEERRGEESTELNTYTYTYTYTHVYNRVKNIGPCFHNQNPKYKQNEEQKGDPFVVACFCLPLGSSGSDLLGRSWRLVLGPFRLVLGPLRMVLGRSWDGLASLVC